VPKISTDSRRDARYARNARDVRDALDAREQFGLPLIGPLRG